MSYQEVLATIKSWPTEQQVFLYDLLRHDLQPVEIDDKILAEIERRSDEYDQGKITAISWSEARDVLRR